MGSVCAISLYLYFLTKGDEELSAIESWFQLFQKLRFEWSFLVQVVLDISTKTCGPCKMIFPKVVQLSIEYPDVVFLKINGDTNADTRVSSDLSFVVHGCKWKVDYAKQPLTSQLLSSICRGAFTSVYRKDV